MPIDRVFKRKETSLKARKYKALELFSSPYKYNWVEILLKIQLRGENTSSLAFLRGKPE